MQRKSLAAAAIAVALISISGAHALCSGGTVAQEYRDASIVVRARLVSQIDAWDDEPSLSFKSRWGDGDLVSLYGLKVLQVFKGAPERRVNVFMPHDSGAFYIDPDKDYLLFLNRIHPEKGTPAAAARAFTVDYACGQSKPWAEVDRTAMQQLRQMPNR